MNPLQRCLRAGLLLAFVWLTTAGCLCPTCPNTRGAATAPAQPPAEDGGAAAVLAHGKRLVIWDGRHIKPRTVGTGRHGHLDFWDGGKSWADCDDKPHCLATFAATAGAGVHGGKALKLHAEGRGWIGAGWNWFGWYPRTAGTDLSPYESLSFQIRVEPASPAAGPDPGTVAVVLACSNSRKSSARVQVRKYDESFDDGKWHKIAVPLTEFTSGQEAGGFDLKKTWELQLSTWNGSPHDFNIYVDQIAAEN